MARIMPAVRYIKPLLFPLQQLLTLSDSSRRLHSEVEDQYTNTNKFTLLVSALKSGSVVSAKILLNFTRPVNFNNETYENKKAYLRYLFSAVILGDESSLEEFYRVIDGMRKVGDIYLMRDIIFGYKDHGFVLKPYLTKLNKRYQLLETPEAIQFDGKPAAKTCELFEFTSQ